jgi:N-methylhydantoinase B
MRGDVDPIRLELIRNGFDTIADEMALILMRAAYSSIVRDAMDFSTAVCDASGRTLAQGLTTPLHLGSLHDAMDFLVENFGDGLEPGDVLIGNDPYISAGQHLPDIYIVRPVFLDGRRIGFAVALAHHVDVGGIIPGSNSLGAYEIFQEGLRLPFLKLYARGAANDAIFQIIRANVRTPNLVLGDLEAQLVATIGAEKSLIKLFRAYGIEAMERYVDALHDYAEALTRHEIMEIPDGTYRFRDEIDGLGANPKPIVFHVELTVAGDRITVDWAGTEKQVQGGINAPFPFTRAASYAALRSVMGGDIPNCHGFTRPITVKAPKGSLVNPEAPAACGARGITGFRMIDCLLGALAKAAPHRVNADSAGGSSLPTFSGWADGTQFVFSETLMGNTGGGSSDDGQEGVCHIGANQSNVPIEIIELDHPIRIERYEAVIDSGGPGKHRGGLGIRRDYRILADNVFVSIRSDKRRFPPHGLDGGGPGAGSMTLLNPGAAGEAEIPVLTTTPLFLNEGDLFSHRLAGGGGYGNPLERDPDAVLADVLSGRVSARAAQEAYGVAVRVTGVDRGEVDHDRTRALRTLSPSAAAPAEQIV